MFIFDAHVDTLSRLHRSGEELETKSGHISLDWLLEGHISAQVFAVFVDPAFYQGMALHQGLEMIDIFWNTIEQYPNYLGFAGSGRQIEELRQQNKIACLLSIEGGEVLEGKLGHLRNLYRLGVRIVTLTWNYRNAIASGQMERNDCGGLSSFGREVVGEMNRLGMMIDVSHLNERSFWDVLETTSAPVIASHSNARALCDHRRNLTDDQIKAIADLGGVIGVNFCTGFLSKDSQASVHDVVDQIMYLVNVGGSQCVGLGSDFDGIDKTPLGLENCSQTHVLWDKLKKERLSDDVIEKVMGYNFLRVTKEVLG